MADFRFMIFNLQSEIYNLKCPAGYSPFQRYQQLSAKRLKTGQAGGNAF
jgi:hypothetical protein